MVCDYVEYYYVLVVQFFCWIVGVQFDVVCELVDYCWCVEEVWFKIEIVDVDSIGLLDILLFGFQLILMVIVWLVGLRLNDVMVQGVLGRVDVGDVLMDLVIVEMVYIGIGDGGYEIFLMMMLLLLVGLVGYIVWVLFCYLMLVVSNEFGLVILV